MKKIIAIILSISAILISAGFGWYYLNIHRYAPESYVTKTESGEVTVNTNTGETTPEIKQFTLADIATRKDASSCYTVISQDVYDLTAFVNMHPGGKDKILSICGVDGTQTFMNKHKGGEKYMKTLSRFKIGVLAE